MNNGTNNAGVEANNMLKKELKSALEETGSYPSFRLQMQEWEIQWDFGPQEASHHGVIYECQIYTIKKALNGFPQVLTKSTTD